MKFSIALVAAASLFLCPLGYAEEVDTEADADTATPDPSSEDPATLVNIDRPDFTPFQLTAPFFEQFTEGWDKRWQPSHAKKVVSGDEEWAFVGTWAVEEPTVFKGINGDKGLIVKDEAAHHAISAKFPKAINNKGKTLVVQYEVKLQDGLECGGAYMKLLKDTKELHQEEFSNASPYMIMFGPDKCGATNKVHFIFRHKNPKTGEYEEKHLEEDVHAKIEKTTTLYTLIVKPDQTFSIKIDGKEESKGSLLENFSPSVNPPKEIDDPEDKKPEDWVENAKMPDPEAKKPDDWDEDAPFEILDEEAEKPDDWLENEPEMITDPDATKPADWDDEEDGDWAAPMVSNPKCMDVSGCGEWTKPMKKNPDYRGAWVAPLIDNPEYKGVWKPRKITNKDYYEDKTPADFEPMGAIGFELWTMQANILFDNIYIGHSVEDAEALQKATFDIKKPIEEKQEEALDAKDQDERDKEPERIDVKFTENPLLYIRNSIDIFIPLFKNDPMAAIKEMPEVAGGIGAVAITVIALVIGSLGLGASSPTVQEGAKKAKDKAAEARDKAADGVSSGIDKATDVTKRATRSSTSSDS